MRATVFRGPFDVRIDQVRDAVLHEPTDAVVRIIHACICGGAPVRAFLPELLADVLAGRLDPSPVLDLTADLDGVPLSYAAMDQRTALKVMVRL
jgi:threonine dehydrogenase-like Zn-dependent dehydrogenase